MNARVRLKADGSGSCLSPERRTLHDTWDHPPPGVIRPGPTRPDPTRPDPARPDPTAAQTPPRPKTDTARRPQRPSRDAASVTAPRHVTAVRDATVRLPGLAWASLRRRDGHDMGGGLGPIWPGRHRPQQPVKGLDPSAFGSL